MDENEHQLREEDLKVVDWVHFEKSRAELGPSFIRILGYFREDGVKSLSQIEEAMHRQDTVALVRPAHTIKGEARQFGAEPLAKLAELIENTARLCIETRRFHDDLIRDVVELRKTFESTIHLFDEATNPIRTRPGQQGAFGRKSTNQSFGRL